MRMLAPVRALLIPACWAVMVVALVTGCSGDKDADPVATAREALAKREYRAAEIALKNALRANPENAEARLLLAEGHIRFGDGRAADTQLDKAAAAGMPENRLLWPRMEAAMLQREFERVLELDVTALNPADYPLELRADLTAIQGDAQLALGQRDAARERYAAAQALVADNASARVGLAQLAARARNTTEARALAQQAANEHPDYAPAWSLLGDLASQAGDLEPAEAAYTRAIDLRDTNRQDLLSRAMVWVALGNLDAARTDAKILKRQGFDLPHGTFARGVVLLAEGRQAQARDEFERVLANVPNFTIASCYLGRAHAATGQYEQAAAQLGRCFKYYGGIPFIRRVYASVLMLNHRVDEAEAVLAPLVEVEHPEPLDLDLLAQTKLASGEPKEAVALLRRILEADDQAPAAHRNLGVALLAAGESAASSDAFKAAENLEAADKGSKEREDGRLLAAKAFIDAGETTRAISQLEALRAEDPKARRPVNFLALAYLKAGKREEAKALLRDFLATDPDYVLGATNLARLHAGDQEFEQAISILGRMNTRDPGNPQIIGLLVAAEVGNGAPSRAETVLDDALNAHPEDPELLSVKARFERSQGRREDALATYGRLAERKQVDPAWLRELRDLQTASGYLPQAVVTAQRLAELPNPNARDQLALESLQSRLGDEAGSARTLKKALEKNPDVLAVRIAQLQSLIRANDLQAAHSELDTLKRRLGEREIAELELLEAALLAREGNTRAARDAAVRALNVGPSSRIVIEVARLQAGLGEPDQAISTLQAWVSKHPKDVAALFVLADALDKQHRSAEAVARYEELLAIDGAQPWALNNLAWLLRESNSSRALQLAQQAITLAPDSPAVLDTLGALELAAGQHDEAVKHLREASRLSPKTPEIRLHLARALLANGAPEEALSVLGGIGSGGLSDTLRAELEALKAEIEDAL